MAYHFPEGDFWFGDGKVFPVDLFSLGVGGFVVGESGLDGGKGTFGLTWSDLSKP